MNDKKKNIKDVVLEVIRTQSDESFQHWMDCTELSFVELSSMIGLLVKEKELALQVIGGNENSLYLPHDKQIFTKFMKLLSKYFICERRVEFYASKMCLSSPYFSTIVKRISGKTPNAWITQRIVEEIKYRLVHTQDSIKKIAYDLNFANQSFFGKFFKMKTGISPAEYRAHNVHLSLSPVGVFAENCNFILDK